MQSDDTTALESKLRRSLMPMALSESATGSIHAMLDELAGAELPAALDAPDASLAPDVGKITPWHAAAAAFAGLLAVAAWLVPPHVEQAAFSATSGTAPTLITQSPDTMRLVDESTHLAWVEDEGWLADPDGGALRAVRMRVVEENRLLDEETGLIVHITSPREEMLLTPVSTF